MTPDELFRFFEIDSILNKTSDIASLKREYDRLPNKGGINHMTEADIARFKELDKIFHPELYEPVQ